LIGTVVVLLIGTSLVVAWPLVVIALGIIVLMKATAGRETRGQGGAQ
jgi:hypothetical protein